MKICMCKDFDEASLDKALARDAVSPPEQIHQDISGAGPDCGACLCAIESKRYAQEQTGKAVPLLKIDREQRIAAIKRLGERFAAETKELPEEQIPDFKKRYITLATRQFKK